MNATSVVRDPERWIIPTALAATTSIVIGTVWDISWHMTVGRDTLWTAPHVLEQVGAAVAGIVCGAYVLWLTFRAPAAMRDRMVRFWGFYGPLGAWVIIWGALAMIVSVPFDNWWHNAYGLDVQILSPPHTVLMTGILGIQVGTMLFTLAAKNRAADGAGRRFHTTAYTYATGVLILMTWLSIYEIAGYANSWHGSSFYRISSGIFPFLLAGVSRGAGRKWGATIAAATYMSIALVMLWILQLFPAEPKLAPIFNRVTHMVPLAFPFVMVAPAFAIDLLQQRSPRMNRWLISALFAAAFVLSMLAVHWPFAVFMLSPAARNHFFGADKWPYMYQVGAWRYQYWNLDRAADGSWSATLFAVKMLPAFAIAFVSARIGVAWGDFARRVMR